MPLYAAIIDTVADNFRELCKVESQRDDLLAACKVHKGLVIAEHGNIHWDSNYKGMEAALAKCKEIK